MFGFLLPDPVWLENINSTAGSAAAAVMQKGTKPTGAFHFSFKAASSSGESGRESSNVKLVLAVIFGQITLRSSVMLGTRLISPGTNEKAGEHG